LPALGLLLLIAQIACAVHAGRSGRPFFWIYLIVFVPFFGMAAYVLLEILPEFLGSRPARQAAVGVVNTLDPGKRLREALRRMEMTPTAENKAGAAAEFLRAGQPGQAIALFREALTGIHATDPGMMLGLAHALFAAGDLAGTQSVLERLRAANPDYNSAEGHLLYARSLEMQDKFADALREYEALSRYYPGQEARCRFALLLEKQGRMAEARQLYQEICQSIDYGPRHQYREQREWYDLAKRQLGGRG
jgi:hypothetical protein